MSRSHSLSLHAVVVSSLLGLLAAGAGGCRSRASARPASDSTGPSAAPPTGGATARAAAKVASERMPVVRPISPVLGGTVAIADVDHRRVAIVADEEESAIDIVDLESRAVVSSAKLEGAPGQLLLAPDGTLFVAVRGAARVVALRLGEGSKPREIAGHATADEPFGLALTPDGKTVLVSTIVDPRIEAFHAADLAPAFSGPLPRDPRSIAVSADGTRAFVTHSVGSIMSVVALAGDAPGTSRTISLDARERRRDFGLPFSMTPMSKPPPPSKKFSVSSVNTLGGVRITMKRTATQGFGLAMIGEKVFLPETLVMTSDNNEGPPMGYGSVAQSTLSTHVPLVARIGGGEKLENAEFSGPADKGCFEKKAECILPRAVTSDGKKLYVACLDSDEILVVDPSEDVEHGPACRKVEAGRARLHVESPSGLAVDTERDNVVAFSIFSRKLSVVSLGRNHDTEPQEIALARTREALPVLAAEGRRLFHQSAEPRIAKNGRACASCHVDGRDDALVWPTPIGKRQTPMLAGRLDGTAPYGWNGEHASLVTHIKSTVKNLEGTGVNDHELEALAGYIASMHAPAKHAAASEAITRGQAIFRSSEAGCSSCHVEETRFTDLGTHKLGAAAKRAGPGFDTPSLAFVGQTAPYFHDGRFTSLDELVDACDRPDTQMGTTKHLPPDDKRALVAYLRSL